MSSINFQNVIVTQRFVLDQKTKDEILSKTPKFGFNGLGNVVFRRTYSRDNETWNDVVIRVIEGTFSIRKEHYFRNALEWKDTEYQTQARNMALSMFDMEWLPPGRGLWMMGTNFVYERGSMALYNCAATDTEKDLVHSAEWTMDSLMNGVGVGFNTRWKGTATIPDKKDTMSYVIPDSREGWVESLIKLMCAYIESPKYGKNKFPIFDYSKIRPAGVPIKGFGGLASGPDPLKKMHSRIEEYLDNFCRGYIEICDDKKCSRKNYGSARLVADIFNAIGACVVAGNVRRSAEIALGSVFDEEFINLKNYDKNPERMEIGWMSNNSVVLDETSDFQNFSYIPEMAARIYDNGEPGLINLYNIQKYGRYGKEMKDEATLVNPCFSEDTLIAVADGRGAVKISELAKEGKDVPVFSIDRNTKEVSVKWGRNPRITGYNQQLLRIHVENGFIDVTPNHKFLLNDGSCVQAKDLKKDQYIPKFEDSNLKVQIPPNKVFKDSTGLAVKTCENKKCRKEFRVDWNKREISFCSKECSFFHNPSKNVIMKENIQKISHVEKLDKNHTVYNITVDDNHTVAIVTEIKKSLVGLFVFQCGEIQLCSEETCNLSEVFPTRCQKPSDFFSALEHATFYCSTVSLLPTHRPETNKIVAKNRRIGVGVGGIAQWLSEEKWGSKMDYTKMTKFLRKGYKIVREVNKNLAEQAGVPPSIRVTTIKPSGTISLLVGCTPGMHYPVSRYAIRRMRIAKDSPLVKPMIEAGIPHEKDQYSENTLVFEFTIDHGDVRPADRVSPWEQFSLIATLQRCYADNCVSATVYFDKEKDKEDIEKMIAMYIPVLKSVSMLPHSGHGYAQAPYEPITKEIYEKRLETYRQPEFSAVSGNVPTGTKYCSNDSCEL